jgi:hypothetical protein
MLWFGNKCHRIRRLLSERVDEPLSTRNERCVAEHLVDCNECRREYEFYRELKEVAFEMEMIRPPTYLWDRISVQVDEHPWGEDGVRPLGARSPAKLWQGNLGLAGAVIALVLVLIIGLMPSGRSSDTRQVGRDAIQEESLPQEIDPLTIFLLSGSDRFPTGVRDYYLRHAESLDRQIRTIKLALTQYPNNRQIQAQLAIAYGQKLQLYREVGSASISGGMIPGSFMIRFDDEERGYE